MSTLSPEKDSLLGLMVQEKIAHQILKNEGFFGQPFMSTSLINVSFSWDRDI